MRLIYIAGPYRSSTPNGIWNNIANARKWAEYIAKRGDFPVTPHMNTAFMDGIQDDKFWLEGTMELLRRCDGIFLIPGWQSSKGSKAELKEAEKLGLTVESVNT